MQELDHKDGWVSKRNWCFQTGVLEKTFESLLDSKIKPVNPKRNQCWIFIARTDAEAEAPILWPPGTNSWGTGKDPEGRRRRGDRGWDGRMASPIQQTWGWANSGRWWWTGKPGMLQSRGITKSQTRLSEWTIKTRPQFVAPWSWTSQPPELWEINACCRSHPVYRVLLQQPKLTKTLSLPLMASPNTDQGIKSTPYVFS